MTSTRVAGARFRQRKLSTKQNLPVVRENEVEQVTDSDPSHRLQAVETGVEKAEEIVSHAIPIRANTSYILKSHFMASRSLPSVLCHNFLTFHRNTISKQSSLLQRLVGRLHNFTSRHQRLCKALYSMSVCTQNTLHNLRPISASPPLLRIHRDVRIV